MFGFVVERVVEVDPEAAVKFEDGKRPVSRAGLLRRRRCRCQKSEDQEQGESSAGGWAHVESHDSSANSFAGTNAGILSFPYFAIGDVLCPLILVTIATGESDEEILIVMSCIAAVLFVPGATSARSSRRSSRR